MRSVTVVLPASMWAMIPIFRVRSSGMDVAEDRAAVLLMAIAATT